MAIFFLLNPLEKAMAADPWPAEKWESAQNYTHLDSDFENNVSGACWNPVTRIFWVCRNGRPSVFWGLKVNSNGHLKIAIDHSGTQAKFDLGEGQSRYELAWYFKEHHHHLVCSECGKMIDYSDFIDDEVKFFAKIQKFLSIKYDFFINNHEVYFYGKCNSCHKTT